MAIVIGLILGAVVVLGLGALAVIHFTSGGEPGPEPAVEPSVAYPEPAPVEPPPPELTPTPVVKATPESEADDYYKQALQRMKSGNWPMAEQLLRSSLKLNPAHKGAQTMLDRALEEKKAAELLGQAREAVDKKDWDVALDLLNQVPGTAQASKAAVSLKPNVIKKYRAYHLNKADRFERNNKLNEAVKELDAVLMVASDDSLAKDRKDKLEKRIADAKKPPQVAVRKTQPRPRKDTGASAAAKKKQAKEMRRQGIDAYKKNQFSKAISYYQKALKLTPRDYDLYRFMGSAHARMGNRKRAYQAYKKYVQLCSRCPYAGPIRKILNDYEELQE